ncbi:sodium/proline symporter PutP [Thalassotalea ponticola]|uniref:sodium/proline symporter PutP n=1 Tax=Thalassotalea ponticola TaxID=1523392 RepID=UPI0025B4CE03|nr:sodium/proline symporter PutP [Thalassotalea ponticola]MDN3651329.1 sodium/proline symporter PutP [Thalassotalea ponticola]
MFYLSFSTISIVLYFVMLIGIGIYAMKKSTANNNEYLLGGRNVSPKVTALSAGASDMSGWMLMGLPGAAYVSGLNSIWLALGLVIGAYVNYQIVAPKLRVFTEVADDSLTIPEFLSKRFALNKGGVRLIASLVIIVFFTVYTASGLVAGGKLFESAFGLHYSWGVIATVSVVVAYTILGGFLAVSLSDFIQGVIMLIALVAVPLATYMQFDQAQMMQFTESMSFSFSNMEFIAALSLMTWGLGYFGQPHIIVRFMAIDSHKNLPRAKTIGLTWMTISIIGAVVTGLVGAAFIANSKQTINDPETIFIFLSQFLFHPFIAGWLLAAILAAIMSTISSQLLVSSSSLVEDIYKAYSRTAPSANKLLMTSRVCVLVVAVVASLIALDNNNSVLNLVSNAWAGFGAAFGPLVLFSLWWKKLTHAGAIAGVVTGCVTVLIWAYVPLLANGQTLSSLFYELLPGFIASSTAIVVVSLNSQKPATQAISWFEETSKKLVKA